MLLRAKSVVVVFLFALFWSSACLAVVAEKGEKLPAPDEFVPLDVFPKMTHREQPLYPSFAKKAGLTGTVVVQALVGVKGDVLKAQVAKSSGFTTLDEAAVRAAEKCKWKPGEFNGKPAASWVTYEVEFILEQTSRIATPAGTGDSGP